MRNVSKTNHRPRAKLSCVLNRPSDHVVLTLRVRGAVALACNRTDDWKRQQEHDIGVGEAIRSPRHRAAPQVEPSQILRDVGSDPFYPTAFFKDGVTPLLAKAFDQNVAIDAIWRFHVDARQPPWPLRFNWHVWFLGCGGGVRKQEAIDYRTVPLVVRINPALEQRI